MATKKETITALSLWALTCLVLGVVIESARSHIECDADALDIGDIVTIRLDSRRGIVSERFCGGTDAYRVLVTGESYSTVLVPRAVLERSE